MREIQFKAKRIDNDQWIEGDLRQWPSGEIGICDKVTNHTFKVKSGTVCQYTGERDRKGVRIFEWDYVTLPAYGGGRCTSIVYFRGGKFAVDGSRYGFKDLCANHMEVIGNVYDGKEDS